MILRTLNLHLSISVVVVVALAVIVCSNRVLHFFHRRSTLEFRLAAVTVTSQLSIFLLFL